MAVTIVIFAVVLVLFIALLLLALFFVRKPERARPRAEKPSGGARVIGTGAGLPAQDKYIGVEIYAFDGRIKSLDDVKGERMGIYRDTGQISGLAEDGPVFKRRVRTDKLTGDELTKILNCAVEVSRVSERTVLYFFTSIKPLTVKSPFGQSVYKCAEGNIKSGRNILCKIETISEEDDMYGGKTADFDDNSL